MESMNFPTLKDYTTWRDLKRIEYRFLSIRIRRTKREIRALGSEAGMLQCSLIGLKAEATQIMDERREAKQIARDSWDAWQAARIAAVAA